MYTCRECESEINQGMEICPHCGADLTSRIGSTCAPAAEPKLRKSLLRWGVLLGVLLAAIWSFVWFSAPERRGNPTAQAEGRAVESLREIGTALHDYAAGQYSGYPPQIEALGDQVLTAVQLAQSVSYKVEYTPGQVEADGLIHTYVLQVKAGNYGFPTSIAMKAELCVPRAKAVMPRFKIPCSEASQVLEMRFGRDFLSECWATIEKSSAKFSFRVGRPKKANTR